MSTFNVSRDQLLEIVQSGQSKAREKIAEGKLFALKTTVQKWSEGYTKNHSRRQFDWEGEVTLENFESQSSNVPSAFQVDYYTAADPYTSSAKSDLGLLNKYELICRYSVGDITMNDREFCRILNAAGCKP